VLNSNMSCCYYYGSQYGYKNVSFFYYIYYNWKRWGRIFCQLSRITRMLQLGGYL